MSIWASISLCSTSAFSCMSCACLDDKNNLSRNIAYKIMWIVMSKKKYYYYWLTEQFVAHTQFPSTPQIPCAASREHFSVPPTLSCAPRRPQHHICAKLLAALELLCLCSNHKNIRNERCKTREKKSFFQFHMQFQSITTIIETLGYCKPYFCSRNFFSFDKFSFNSCL